ncbi:MAG: hypothetical protein Q8882_05050 [Bacillota bacterium]|nr:hypothetical protein [Bacillota bacterium]
MEKISSISLEGNQQTEGKEKNIKIKNLLYENRNVLLAADTTTPVRQNGICYDGIIDEVEFARQNKKIIFLLKETNGNDSNGNMPSEFEDWDYRWWLENKQANGGNSNDPEEKFYGKTFYNLCMWVNLFYRCIELHDLQPFENYRDEYFHEDLYRQILKKTAIVNLKKTWGGSTTNWADLNAYLNNNAVRDVLKKEIAIIAPDIVVCGGRQVFDFARQIFDSQEQQLTVSESITSRYFKYKNALFVDFYHPSCRKKRSDLYYFAAEQFTALNNIQ